MIQGDLDYAVQHPRPLTQGALRRRPMPLVRTVPMLLSAICSALSLLCCHPTPKHSVTEAQFGLFFGGQIQQRSVLAIDTNASVQPLGFRLLFEAPVTHSMEIEWSLDLPTAKVGPRGPSNVPRGERIDRAILPKGAERFDQLLRLRSTDLPGTYNLRIKVDEETVLDRPFRLTWSRGEDE